MPQVKPMRSWARVLLSFDELPDVFGRYLCSELAGAGEFPYMVFAPPERVFSGKAHSKVIGIIGDEIVFCERERKQVNIIRFHTFNINYVEHGCFLLNSWIRINGTVGGRTETAEIAYNTVSESLFKPFLDKARRICYFQLNSGGTEKPDLEKQKFDFLSSAKFKFMVMGISSIEPGEHVNRIVFQPEIKSEYLKLFGRSFQKTILRACLFILTDHEIILICDPDSDYLKTGGSRCFIPLGRLFSVSLGESENRNHTDIDFRFLDGTRLQGKLDSGKKKEWIDFTEAAGLRCYSGV